MWGAGSLRESLLSFRNTSLKLPSQYLFNAEHLGNNKERGKLRIIARRGDKRQPPRRGCPRSSGPSPPPASTRTKTGPFVCAHGHAHTGTHSRALTGMHRHTCMHTHAHTRTHAHTGMLCRRLGHFGGCPASRGPHPLNSQQHLLRDLEDSRGQSQALCLLPAAGPEMGEQRCPQDSLLVMATNHPRPDF